MLCTCISRICFSICFCNSPLTNVDVVIAHALVALEDVITKNKIPAVSDFIIRERFSESLVKVAGEEGGVAAGGGGAQLRGKRAKVVVPQKYFFLNL